MRKNLGILLSFLLFAAAPAAFAQTESNGEADGSGSTNGGVNSETSGETEEHYALHADSLRKFRMEDGRKIYTVEMNWKQGRLYNQAIDNVESSRFLAQWFNYDHPTMSINAVYNNFALESTLGHPLEADANGNIPMNLHYGIAHAPVTITAPRGWKLTKVTIDGKAMGTTAKVASANGRYILHREDDHNRPASAWDAVASKMGNYRYSVDTAKYEVIGTTDGVPTEGKSDFGKVYAFFLPDNYVWPTKKERENDTDTTFTSVADLKAAGYNVNHFEWVPTEPTNQFQFHLNGDNTGIQAVFQVSFEQCDSVENVTFHVFDDNNKRLTPESGLVRTLRKAHNGEATVPQDFDRSFCTYTWCDANGEDISEADAANVKANGKVYLKLTRNENYPFRTANIPEGTGALTSESASADLRSAGFYYISIGNTHYLKANTDNTIQLEADPRNLSDEWFALGEGDAFNGWKLMNFNNPKKYLTMAAEELIEGSDHNLSFKEKLAEGERNLWIPLTSKYSHATGHDMNSDYPALGVAMRDNAFFLVPVKANSAEFEQDKMRWHLTALKKVDGAENAAEKQLKARTGRKPRFTENSCIRDERDEKSRILLHEITDVDVKVVNNADTLNVWADFEEGLRLKHVCELQTIDLNQNLPIVKASKVGRDYCTFANNVVGTATDQLHVDDEGGKELRATFELFNVSTSTEAPEYKYFIKAAPRLQRGTGDNAAANNTYLYNDTEASAIKATTDGSILSNEQRKDDKFRWFFTGNPYQGFVCYNTADGKVLKIDGNALSMADAATQDIITLRPDSAYIHSYAAFGDAALIDATEAMTYYNTLPRGAQAKGGAAMRQCFNLVRTTTDDVSTYLEQAWPSLALTATGSDNTITGNDGSLSVRTNAADALSEFILVPVGEDIHHFVLRKKGDNNREYAEPITEVVTSNDTLTINLREWIRDYCRYTCTTIDNLAETATAAESDESDANLSFTLPKDLGDKGSSTYGTSQRGLTYTIIGTGENAELTHFIEWTWDGPFLLSTETEKHWYLVKYHDSTYDTDRYILADNKKISVTPAGWNNEDVNGSYQGLDDNYGPKHIIKKGCVFAFIGNPYDGFYVNSIKGDDQYLHMGTDAQNIGTSKQLFRLYEAAPRQADGSFDPRFCFQEDNGYQRFWLTYGWASKNAQSFYNELYNQNAGCQYRAEDVRPTMKRFFDHFLEAPKGTIYGLTDEYYDEWNGKTEKILSYDGAAVKELFETEKAIGDPASLEEFRQYRNTIKANTPYRLISVGRELSGSTNYVSMVNGYGDQQLRINEVSDSTREAAEAKALTNPSTVFVSGSLGGYGTRVDDFGWQRVEGGLRTQGLKIQTTNADAAVSLGSNNPNNFFVDYANDCQATCSPYAVVRTGGSYFNVDSDGTIKGVNNGRTTPAACYYIVPATEFKGTIGVRGKTSFYLDFPVEIPSEGITQAWYVQNIGDFDGTTDGTATTAAIEASTILRAGTPFFVTGKPDSVVTFSIHASTGTAPAGNRLSGKYLPQSYNRETAADIVYSYGKSATSEKVGFFKYLGTTIPANRAFLTLPRDNAASGVNFFSLIESGESTGIGSVEVPQTEQAVIYDMQGRRVAQPTRNGLYIVNGKKVYLKAN